MKISFSTEVKTAILVTAVIAAFIWGFNLLKGTNFFRDEITYYAVYNDISGLIKNNPVLVNGYHIGQVGGVWLHPDDKRMVVVKIDLFEHLNIPKNSSARIYSSDLLGSKAIDLILGNDTAIANPGDTLGGQTENTLQEEVNRQVIPLKKKAEELILSIDSVITVVQTILNQSARENLTASFESIKRAIHNFENTSIKLDELVESERTRLHNIFSNLESITSNIQNNNQAITTAINNISSISDTIAKARLAAALVNTEKAMGDFSSIIEKINRGEGSLGLLLNNDTLYNNLSQATANMNELTRDLHEHPGRYVHFSIFGRKDNRSDRSKRSDR